MRFSKNFQESMSVNSKKIYDSCASKDYIENLQCFFTEPNQSLVNQAVDAKIKDANVIFAKIDIENLKFKDGLFLINQTFFFKIEVEIISVGFSNFLNALCVFSKNMTLFGGKSDVKTFYSGENKINDEIETLPSVVVQVSKPLVLSSSLNDNESYGIIKKAPNIPANITEYFGGDFSFSNILKYVNLNLGLFSITHLERDMQMLMPICEIGKPTKKCNSGISAREAFEKTLFPVRDFFPL